jgi:hypothetical protein
MKKQIAIKRIIIKIDIKIKLNQILRDKVFFLNQNKIHNN